MNPDQMIAVRNDKTIYRDGDRCLKVFHEEFTKADVLNEALNQARVEETGLRIPQVLEVTQVDGKWAVISEYVEGKTLFQLAKEEPDRTEELLQLFVNLQAEIHHHSCKKLNSLREKLRLAICMTDFSATERYSLHAQLEALPKRSNLCHGDYYPANVLLTKEGKPYILDWSHVSVGNTDADVAQTYLLLRFHCVKGFDAEQYLSLYCEKTGTDAAAMHAWIPVVAATAMPEANAEKRAFLRPWAEHVK